MLILLMYDFVNGWNRDWLIVSFCNCDFVILRHHLSVIVCVIYVNELHYCRFEFLTDLAVDWFYVCVIDFVGVCLCDLLIVSLWDWHCDSATKCLRDCVCLCRSVSAETNLCTFCGFVCLTDLAVNWMWVCVIDFGLYVCVIKFVTEWLWVFWLFLWLYDNVFVWLCVCLCD